MNAAFCARQLGHSVEMFHRTYAKWLDGEQNDREKERLETAIAPKAGAGRDAAAKHQNWPGRPDTARRRLAPLTQQRPAHA